MIKKHLTSKQLIELSKAATTDIDYWQRRVGMARAEECHESSVAFAEKMLAQYVAERMEGKPHGG